MGAGGRSGRVADRQQSWRSFDRVGAENGAAEAGVARIVYLGGLRPPPEDSSPEHLASRAEVGDVFLRSPVPAAVLQAAVITGSGSTSFEIVRYLTDRMPVMATPGWVDNRPQPISIADVLRYLVASAELPSEVNRSFDVGGPDVLTYWDMMQRYARIAGLPRRLALPIPLVPAALSAWWVGLMTPVSRQLAKPLIESLDHELVCREHDIRTQLPAPPGGLLDYEQSVRAALPRPPACADVADPAAAMASDVPGSGGASYEQRWDVACTASAARLWRVVEGVSAAGTAGTPSRSLSSCVGRSISSSAGSARTVAVVTRCRCAWGRSSTRGASKRSNRAGASCCARR